MGTNRGGTVPILAPVLDYIRSPLLSLITSWAAQRCLNTNRGGTVPILAPVLDYIRSPLLSLITSWAAQRCLNTNRGGSSYAGPWSNISYPRITKKVSKILLPVTFHISPKGLSDFFRC